MGTIYTNRRVFTTESIVGQRVNVRYWFKENSGETLEHSGLIQSAIDGMLGLLIDGTTKTLTYVPYEKIVRLEVEVTTTELVFLVEADKVVI